MNAWNLNDVKAAAASVDLNDRTFAVHVAVGDAGIAVL